MKTYKLNNIEISEQQVRDLINQAIANVNQYIRENDCKIENVDWGDYNQEKEYCNT